MPEPLNDALTRLRPLLLDPDGLLRAVAAGRRRAAVPAHVRAELRPVRLKAGPRIQVVTTDGRTPTIRNLEPGAAVAAVVDELLAEPFGSWHVETRDQVVQLRVTKRGEAQVHAEQRTPPATDRSGPADLDGDSAGNSDDGDSGGNGDGGDDGGGAGGGGGRDDGGDGGRGDDDGGPGRGGGGGGAGRGGSAGAGAGAGDDRSHDRARQHLIDPADPLFRVLGADGAKRRQVDAFLRQLAPIARRVAPAGRPLRVVDLGCGNAYLTIAAHRYLAQDVDASVRTVGVDIRPEMAERNTRLAAQIGLTGITFVAASIEAATAAIASEEEPVDVALALHACDTATDDALAMAVRWQARAVLAAPCCHHDVQRQIDGSDARPPFPGLTRHAILRERFADVLTDAVRADLLRLLGYRVDVVEFVGSRHTPRNALIRAVRTGAVPTARRIEEYTDLVGAWGLRPALAQRLAAELDPVLPGPA